MSKKKIYNKHLEKGRFYIHADGNGGHPALLYKKRDKNNLYFILIFVLRQARKEENLNTAFNQRKSNNLLFIILRPSLSEEI